jgi:hypothetical protein
MTLGATIGILILASILLLLSAGIGKGFWILPMAVILTVCVNIGYETHYNQTIREGFEETEVVSCRGANSSVLISKDKGWSLSDDDYFRNSESEVYLAMGECRLIKQDRRSWWLIFILMGGMLIALLTNLLTDTNKENEES